MALFNFNTNKEIRFDNNFTSNTVDSGISSQYKNTVWEDELPDIPTGDGFVRNTKVCRLGILAQQ